MKRLTPLDCALWTALPMAHTSKIESRITMILDNTRRRTLPRRTVILALAVGGAALVPLAMLRPAARAQAGGHPHGIMQGSRGAARVSAESAVPGEFNESQLVEQGKALGPDAAALLQKTLEAKPNDAAHLQLLGYFQSRQYASPAAKTGYEQQVFWIIREHPESALFSYGDISLMKRDAPAAFETGEKLWREQVADHPNIVTIIGNAAEYCLMGDDDEAERLLHRAEALQPASPVWPTKLGQLYRLQGEGPNPSPARVRETAKKALVEYEAAARLANKTAEPNGSADLAKTAFDAGEYDKAEQYAAVLLHRGEQIAAAGKTNPSSPEFIFHENDDALHEANLVLGQLALRSGDIPGAEAHLLAMGHVTGSSSLASFGPNMQLAEDLLKAGRRDVVLTYFDECGKFWKDKRLGTWRTEVTQGKIPNFSASLYY